MQKIPRDAGMIYNIWCQVAGKVLMMLQHDVSNLVIASETG
jgi:hypothetical protein